MKSLTKSINQIKQKKNNINANHSATTHLNLIVYHQTNMNVTEYNFSKILRKAVFSLKLQT